MIIIIDKFYIKTQKKITEGRNFNLDFDFGYFPYNPKY